jgi:hypothetical protein
MADIVQELAIVLGVDASGLEKGIHQAATALQSVADQASAAVGGVAEAVTGSSGQAVAASASVQTSVTQIGKAAEDASKKAKGAFGSLASSLGSLKKSLAGVLTTLVGGLASAKAFDDYINKANGLETMSRKTGIAVKELDAWSKANVAAGGTAEALQSTLENFYKKTGRPATEFFKLGQRIEGMSRLQAQRFLETQGVALDAIPIFLKGQKAADELVSKYRQTAFTEKDTKLARAFKNAWDDFRTAAGDVASVAFRAVLPALTALGRWMERLMKLVRDNIQFLTILGVVLAVAFGAKHLGEIKAMIMAVKAFGIALSTSFLPLTAIVAAVVALGLAIDDLMTFAQGGDSMIERMMRSIGIGSETIEEVRKSFGTLFDAIGKVWDAVKPLFSGALSLALKAISGLLTGIAVIIAGLIAAVTTVITKIDDWAKALYNLMPSFDDIGKFFGKVGTWVDDAAKQIKEGFSKAFDIVGAWVKGLFGDWFKSFVSTFIEPIKNLAEAAKGGVSGLWNAAKDALGFGKKDNPPSAQQQSVLQQSSTTNSMPVNSTMNQVINIQTADNPQAIGAAVGAYTNRATDRMSTGAMQAVRGVRLKG